MTGALHPQQEAFYSNTLYCNSTAEGTHPHAFYHIPFVQANTNSSELCWVFFFGGGLLFNLTQLIGP